MKRLRETWENRYSNSYDPISSVRVLTAFNANIDIIRNVSELSIDVSSVDPRNHDVVENVVQLRQQIRYSLANNESMEVDTELDAPDLGPAEERIGGQAGIMTTFLERIGAEPVFYTPFISSYLVKHLPDTTVSIDPDTDQFFVPLDTCINASETKCNTIIEYGGDHPGRIIFSSSIKGFEPVFTTGIMDRIEEVNKGIDTVIVSGYHNVPKDRADDVFEEAKRQLRSLDPTIHLEYVYKEDRIAEYIAKYIMPQVDSLGIDEHELRKLTELHEMDLELGETVTIEDAHDFCSIIMEKYSLKRVHLHTYQFHIIVVDKSYSNDREKIRDGMIFAEKAAVATAATGSFPDKKTIANISLEETQLNGMEQMRQFGDVHGDKTFPKTGIYSGNEEDVIVIPVLVNKEPERLVGLGDIISSAAFTAEAHTSS